MSILLAVFQSILGIVGSLARIERALAVLAEQNDQILTLLTFEPAAGFRFSSTLDGQTKIGIEETTMTDSQQETLTIAPVDKKGKPAQLDGVPVWATSDETVATVDASADPTGLNAILSGVAPGSCRVTVTGDADLGSGVSPITGTLDVTITAGQAVTVAITEGTPTEQA